MKESPLLALFTGAGAAIGDYRGAQTALRFPHEVADPFWAAALCDWSWRARLAVTGPEARKWLNGIISANVRDLAPGRATPSFFLDPKGRVLSYFDVVAAANDGFLLLCDQSAAGDLAAQLRRYVFRAQVEIADRTDEGISLGVCGPEAEAALGRLGPVNLPTAAGTWTETTFQPGITARVLRWVWGGIVTFEILVGGTSAGGLWSRLAAVAQPAGAEAQERQRIAGGVARPGLDLRPTDLAPETGLFAAVGLAKGCYVGQEIVERVRARGAVHRQLRRLRFAGPVAAGAKIVAADREVGEVTSAAPLADGQTAALGYLRNEAASAPFTADGQPGHVADAPAAGQNA
ncbi:MAG TPA: hypothetical protein VE996_13245 [Terriglobales bacterium]|nr:hypothetical protein [Terriglobales bacterium]